MAEDIILRCCICKRAEKEPVKGSLFSDTYLSEKCFKNYYGDSLDASGFNFPHKTCDDLFGPYDDNGQIMTMKKEVIE